MLIVCFKCGANAGKSKAPNQLNARKHEFRRAKVNFFDIFSNIFAETLCGEALLTLGALQVLVQARQNLNEITRHMAVIQLEFQNVIPSVFTRARAARQSKQIGP